MRAPLIRLIEPGSRTALRPATTPDGLIDLRAAPLDPVPDRPRHYAVARVGAASGTQFEVRAIPGPRACPPGAVIVTYGPATTPGSAPGQVAVVVSLAQAARCTTVALWPDLNAAWPEIIRPTVAFAARTTAPVRATRVVGRSRRAGRAARTAPDPGPGPAPEQVNLAPAQGRYAAASPPVIGRSQLVV
jgi:hypothetical protein